MGYVAETYYAKFEKALTDLTITKAAAEDSSVAADQTFVFTIEGKDDLTKGINLTIVIEGIGSVTIVDIPIGSYEVEERPVLHVEAAGQRWHALNDVVLSRGGRARLTTINAFVDDELSGRYVADGVVVATPTGSTGYSLSAGGPIISPKVDCMVITPICAHTLQHRPTVVHGGAHIDLELIPDDMQTASLQVDGQSCVELRSGMCASIRMDSRPIRLIRLKEQRFFQLVRDKLTEWTR